MNNNSGQARFPLMKNGMPHNVDGSSITMEQWLGEPPSFDHFDREIATDVLVIGAGIAGVCAVRAATENGASVVLFEKTHGPKGRSGDVAVIGSRLEKEWWGRDNTAYTEEIINHFMRDLGWRPNYRTIRYWAYHNGDAFDWFMEGTPDIPVLKTATAPAPADQDLWVQPMRHPLTDGWKPDDEYIGSYPVSLRISPTLVPTMYGNYLLARKTGKLTMFADTPARCLLRDGTGTIRGAVGTNVKTGEVIRCQAKAVVLATGGFSGDPEMLYYYVPWAARDLNAVFLLQDPESKQQINAGDGHKMGMWIGAAMEDGPLGLIDHCLGGALGCSGFLNLNRNGERFMNEEVPGQEWEHAVSRQPGTSGWQIFDADWAKQVSHLAPGHGSVCGIVPDGEYPNPLQFFDVHVNYVHPDTAENSCLPDHWTRGASVKADTIEELVEKLEWDEAAKQRAVASIKRYNELAHSGVDADFGKRSNHLFPVETPPFYASRFGTGELLCTVGGLDCDHDGRVLDETRRPIPGLYAAGNVQGGRFPSHYPILIPGISHSMCFTYGRRTGELAAKFATEQRKG